MKSEAGQLDLFGGGQTLPEGFRYRENIITAGEEGGLIRSFAALPFQAFDFHGFKGNRRTVSFGARYDYTTERLEAAEPIPELLLPLREKAAIFAALPAKLLTHALVTEYAPGAGIGWHRDKDAFDQIVGVSLGSACLFRLRKRSASGWDRVTVDAEPRSAYLLSGPARTVWEHSIPPVETLRYSVTFRALRCPR